MSDPRAVCAGLVDNAMMVMTGEVIDTTLGVVLGLSCLGAAALGNAFSNALGMVLHGTIEVRARQRTRKHSRP